jgi:2-methylcitrate dehydratase PrpD
MTSESGFAAAKWPDAPTTVLTEYLVRARTRALPDQIAHKGKLHILDTIAAMISGTTLPAGKCAIEYASFQGPGLESTVIGLDHLSTATTAALTNGMLAHADETDDSHGEVLVHLGCATVPAALAMAERNAASGEDLLKSVVMGYDVGARIMRSLKSGAQQAGTRRYARHSVAGCFAAATAAGAMTKKPLDQTQWEYLLSYAAHQASGLPSYSRDSDHIEKGFIFGGMPARNGLMTALMLEAGFTGIRNDLEGPDGFLACFGDALADPEPLQAELGTRFEIAHTNIKKYCVGSPCQAPIECLANIIEKHNVGYTDFERFVLQTPTGETPVTRSDQLMPDLNVRYLLAVTLLDRRLTFQAGHDEERMRDPDVIEIRNRTDITANPEITAAGATRPGRGPAPAILEFVTKDGRSFVEHVVNVRGVTANPMSSGEVIDKARELFQLVLPTPKADRLIETILELETLESVAELRPLLAP